MKNKNLLLIGAAVVGAFFLLKRKGGSVPTMETAEGEMDLEVEPGAETTAAEGITTAARGSVEMAEGVVSTAKQVVVDVKDTFARTPEQREAAAKRRAIAKAKRTAKRKAAKTKRTEKRAAAKSKRIARRQKRKTKRSMGEIYVI